MTRVKQILLGRETTTLIALVLVLAVFSILNPAYLSTNNFVDILDQATINGLQQLRTREEVAKLRGVAL